MTTAADLIQQAYYLSNVLDPNEEIEGFYASNGLTLLNSILDNWAATSLYIPYYEAITVNVLENVSQYNLTYAVAEFLEGHYIDSNNNRYVLAPANLKQHNSFNYENSTGNPNYLFVQTYDNVVPQVSSLFFFPTPIQNYTATLYIKRRLLSLSEETTITTLPAYYFTTLKFALARYLAIENGTMLSQEFKDEYTSLMRRLKSIAQRDASVNVYNPFARTPLYRPWNVYVN